MLLRTDRTETRRTLYSCDAYTCSWNPDFRLNTHSMSATAAHRALVQTSKRTDRNLSSGGKSARSPFRHTTRNNHKGRSVTTTSAFFGQGSKTTQSKQYVLSSNEVTPGQGKGSPKWNEIHEFLTKENVKAVEAVDLHSFANNKNVLLIDVRQTIEFQEWSVPPSVNCPYAIPDPNVIRRAVGYAVSIKGGLKVRNPDFLETVREIVKSKGSSQIKTIVVVDTKGGNLDVDPTAAGTSGVYDTTDSQSLRAVFELTQAGDFGDVRYVKGGLPGAIDVGNMEYESEKWGGFLEWLTDTNRDDTRKLLMYSRLLPDPTNLPGVVGQGGIFLFLGLAYYDVGGIGGWAAENIPAACSFLPVCL